VVNPAARARVEKVAAYLNERRIKSYLVGGCVRDWLMGRSAADIDIAIEADALILARDLAAVLGGTFVLLDEENRMARIAFSAGIAEENRPAQYVDFSSITGDIRQDLSRRDFTIDALAIELDPPVTDLRQKPVMDFFCGRRDIENKTITAMGEGVFQADPIRLLRAVRLAAELGFQIAPETADWIRRDHQLIERPAGERVREELLKILAVPGAGYFIHYLDDLKLLTAMIPELEIARGSEQPPEHHWDVLAHSLETVRAVDFMLHQGAWEYAVFDALAAVPWSEKLDHYFATAVGAGSTRAALLRLAALLHDIAKPATRILSGDRLRFFGHDERGAEIVKEILERLRFSQREIKLVEALVSYHMRPTQLSQSGPASPRAIYRYFRDTGNAAVDILFLSLADHLAARGPELAEDDWRSHADQTNHVLSAGFKEESPPPRLIDGHDLMNIFGLKPGPRIGMILEDVKEAQAAGELTSRDEALSYIKNRLL
jgi:poly(A) polymerase